jgi:hypothetical protein
MSEFRSDQELPAVLDSDADALEKVAAHIINVVNFQIPGFGIDHVPDSGEDEVDVHNVHRKLVYEALNAVDPPLTSVFGSTSPHDFSQGADIHLDFTGHYPTIDRQSMVIKLHTTGYNGANVVLVNAGKGSTYDIGDQEVFDLEIYGGQPLSAAAQLGYDTGEDMGLLSDHRRFLFDGSGYDPIYSESIVYHHKQNPLCSVLFRSLTTMGPATVHKFKALNPDNPGYGRPVMVTELQIQGQRTGFA